MKLHIYIHLYTFPTSLVSALQSANNFLNEHQAFGYATTSQTFMTLFVFQVTYMST